MKIDRNNTDPKYWEDVLAKYQLAEEQLDLDIDLTLCNGPRGVNFIGSCKGERHPHIKFTDLEIAEIRENVANKTKVELMSQFNMSEAHLYYILKGGCRVNEDIENKKEIFEDDETNPERTGARRTITGNQDFNILRTKLDGDDPFMDNGHQIKKIRVRERITPDWAVDNEKLRAFIELVFPLWKTDARQRFRASKWISVIYLYHRVKLPRSAVAKEMRIPEETVKRILKGINRVARGRRSDNRKLLDTTPSTLPV